ncbi:hypothetical protein ABFS82_08G204100 [Erythranthe guttata]|uniref:Heat stress transcription factor n=1 Tax=Erythranthe guttata TaxID=4155 RepID=A0A022QPW1_ERYGU|nr:PREDICTED: heat stress transcription factor A-4b-like [Erythranthe guttata]EYU30742.1 hypothetical protein MIMGU_mgv1a020913mg [Erythranthe guttata]|eukprot:XP_012845027.1 PREDICTED: heat stress transcription factor A-4b-like [Erythranthe guttata]
MDGSNGGNNSAAPFLVKTYEMVDDPKTSSVVSWSPTGLSFVVWNPPDFARDLLPNYFKHNNFSSFIRQLNTYGFRKIDPDQWEFANEEFIRGQRHLLKNIYRRKPIHSHSGQANASSFTNSEREDYEKEIEKMNQEKNSLQSQIERHKQENRGYEYQLRSLEQTLQSIDQRQQQLMATLAQLLQTPRLEHSHNKKRRLLALHFLHGECKHVGEPKSTTFTVNNTSDSLPLLDLEQVEKLDSSLSFWETFLDGIDQTLSEDEFMVASSGDSDLRAPPPPPFSPVVRHMSASHSRDCNSSSSNYDVDSPAISSICIDMDSRQKPTLGIDVNLSPTKTPDAEMPNEREISGGAAPSLPAGANDVFWQQFLTEAPGSSPSMAKEVQSERRD